MKLVKAAITLRVDDMLDTRLTFGGMEALISRHYKLLMPKSTIDEPRISLAVTVDNEPLTAELTLVSTGMHQGMYLVAFGSPKGAPLLTDLGLVVGFGFCQFDHRRSVGRKWGLAQALMTDADCFQAFHAVTGNWRAIMLVAEMAKLGMFDTVNRA